MLFAMLARALGQSPRARRVRSPLRREAVTDEHHTLLEVVTACPSADTRARSYSPFPSEPSIASTAVQFFELCAAPYLHRPSSPVQIKSVLLSCTRDVRLAISTAIGSSSTGCPRVFRSGKPATARLRTR